MLIYCVTVVSWHLQHLLKKEIRDWFSLELKPFHTKFCRKATAKLCRQAIFWWQGATGPLTCSLSLNGKRWFSVTINKVLMVQRSPRTGPHSGSLTWCLYSSVWPLPPFTWGDTTKMSCTDTYCEPTNSLEKALQKTCGYFKNSDFYCHTFHARVHTVYIKW